MTEKDQRVDQRLLRRVYGLTRSEARLAALLANGRAPQQAAGELGVTLNTLRSHLKRLLQKTGTRRQADLVRVVIRSATAIWERHGVQ